MASLYDRKEHDCGKTGYLSIFHIVYKLSSLNGDENEMTWILELEFSVVIRDCAVYSVSQDEHRKLDQNDG